MIVALVFHNASITVSLCHVKCQNDCCFESLKVLHDFCFGSFEGSFFVGSYRSDHFSVLTFGATLQGNAERASACPGF